MIGKHRNNRQDIYHHSDSDGPRVAVKVEKNSKGYNWECSVSGVKTVVEAIAMLQDAEQKMSETYGAMITGTVGTIGAQ